MSTLETQYKDYLIEHPNSTFSFEEWKEHILGRKLDTVLNIKLDEETYPLNFIRYLTGFSKQYIREKYDKWSNEFRDDETKTNKNTGIYK